MDSRISSAVTVAQKRLGHELRQYALIFVYLYVCFGALILYKMAILRGQTIGSIATLRGCPGAIV